MRVVNKNSFNAEIHNQSENGLKTRQAIRYGLGVDSLDQSGANRYIEKQTTPQDDFKIKNFPAVWRLYIEKTNQG